MLRLITSRWVRLALAAAVTTAIVVAVLRLRRSPAVSGAVPRAGTVPEPRVEVASRPEAGTEPGLAPRWPPAPILGTPTADDLRRYATSSRIPGFFTREPVSREPLDHAARRRLTRWGAAACALCLLALGAQVLENATFSKETETRTTWEFAESDPDSCPPYGESGRRLTVCLEEDPTFSGERLEGSRLLPEEVPFSEPTSGPTPIPAPAQEQGQDGPGVDADCHPVVRAPRARPLSPKVAAAVGRQWTRIERWLKANAPESYRTLAAPARGRTVAIAEAQMGLRFPDDLRASLLRHNGVVVAGESRRFGPMGHEILGIRQIRDTWRMLCGIDDTDETEPGERPDPRTEWWDGRMIPFTSDGVGGHLLVDSVEHDVGDSREDGPIGFTPGGVRIRSYYALLKATADALETGGMIGGWKPVLTGEALDWRYARSG